MKKTAVTLHLKLKRDNAFVIKKILLLKLSRSRYPVAAQKVLGENLFSFIMRKNIFSEEQSSHKQSRQSKKTHHVDGGYSAAGAAKSVQDTQWRKWHTDKGHGYSAEDANALNDILHGKKVEKVGSDNSFRGPDRIVDGQSIQTKYCNSAYRSVNNAFTTTDGVQGDYQYPGQVLEVPKDQYEEAVRIMEQKIRDGHVPGVSDPAQAKNIVKAGSVTYQQAVDIAKAGTLESLKFDIKNNAISGSCAGGISFVITLAMAKHNGASNKEAIKVAGKETVKTAGKTILTGVASQQFLRTATGKASADAIRMTCKKGLNAAAKTQLGKKAIEKTASTFAGKTVTGKIASSVLSRGMSANVITSAASFGISEVGEIVNLCRGKISGKQFAKNTIANGAGTGGGMGGTWAGAAVGSMICPGIGTVVGGIIGGVVGGISSSTLVKKILK